MSAIHLTISHVSKRFGPVEVLKDISLEIPKGCLMTLLGPSGCGKTTMLRTIAGFYSADRGEIRIGERVINDVPSHQRNAIMVFQDYALFPHMTVGENIAYGLRLKKLPHDEIRRRVDRTSAYLGISGLEHRTPGQISGGQQQRVALARALVMEPEVLLLDEPLSNLDAKLRMNIRAELRQLQQSFGITTIYVTHDQSEALALSDFITVMNDGRVVQVGSPREIYYRPRTAFVADFIGTANLIAGSVRTIDGRDLTVQAGGAVLRVENDDLAGAAVRIGSAVTLCCRPEAIELLAAPPAEGNLLVGEIVNSIFEGSHARYWIKVDERIMVADDAGVSEKGMLRGTIYLRLDPRRLHVLVEEALP
jgi:ABC-type Fe3+/spermidine/putrescine transport system ATPase subunit